MSIIAYVLIGLLFCIGITPAIGAITARRTRGQSRPFTQPYYGHANNNELDRCGCRSCMCDVH